jgi:hypothetical protein
MCNRTVGLISRVIEESSIPTISLSINREWSEKVRAPRTGFVKFPYGAGFGEPGNLDQQMTILRDLFVILQSATEPGKIVDLPYRWRRSKYEPVEFSTFTAT